MRWLKWIGTGLAAVVGLCVVIVLVMNAISYARQQKTYKIDVAALTIPGDSASIERGRHLATSVGSCSDCHASDFGGRVLINDALMGRLAGTNLTAGEGGLDATYTDQDFVRAIRHGVGRDGKSLVFMPAESFQAFSDADLASIIAYLRGVAPVNRTLPARRIGPLARVLHLVGFPLLPAEKVDHSLARSTPAPGATVEYGEYLATAAGCRGCHGSALAGSMNGPNITRGAIGAWSASDFANAVRLGRTPDGRTLTDQMPWKNFGDLTDMEVQALYLFVRTVPAVAPKKK